MKNKTKLCIAFFLLTTIKISFAQKAHKYLREADANYQQGDFKTSEEKYKKADEVQPDDRTRYNLGNAMYRQQRLEEAEKQYESVIKQRNALPNARANALHNLGNIQFHKKDYAKAVESYRNALKINPKDVATKRNLAIAQKRIPPPPPQSQQQQQNQNQNQNQQQQNQKQSDNKNDKQDNGQNTPQNQQQNNQNNNQNQQQQQQQMSHDDLRQMLQIMENEEKKVQQRLQKGKPKPNRSAKDW
jgi:tetratricopeptide (TPR) repeat protein